jgi:alpha-ketoglutarate-dependent taurine dioxygenase
VHIELREQFGAVITGCDLNNLDELTFHSIQEAIYVYNVVIIKEQHDLLPINQSNLVQRLDPEAHIEHGWGTSKEAEETTGVTGVGQVIAVFFFILLTCMV